VVCADGGLRWSRPLREIQRTESYMCSVRSTVEVFEKRS
jgi:hypothetical protein